MVLEQHIVLVHASADPTTKIGSVSSGRIPYKFVHGTIKLFVWYVFVQRIEGYEWINNNDKNYWKEKGVYPQSQHDSPALNWPSNTSPELIPLPLHWEHKTAPIKNKNKNHASAFLELKCTIGRARVERPRSEIVLPFPLQSAHSTLFGFVLRSSLAACMHIQGVEGKIAINLMRWERCAVPSNLGLGNLMPRR